MLHTVLPSKLSAPFLAPFQLERARLGAHMERGGRVRLVAVRAPAGFGKTTAMRQYAARREAAGDTTSWLNLDSSDNDLSRFVAHFEAAIAVAAPRPDDACGEPGVLELMGRIAASTQQFTLFLDDFEAIQSSTVLDLLRQVLDMMPPAWQVVIGSRIAPSLGLGRMRARGQVLEVGLSQLRFTLEETVQFMRDQRGLALVGPALERLHKVTEGWATALWLASVALEGHGAPEAFLDSFSGSHAAITEFLAEDVLARLPQTLSEFLLQTSVLQRFDASICDALLGSNDSAALLSQLEQSNLFMVSLDQPGQYRYHSLFADFLRHQLALRDPAAPVRLHLRASEWYESAGRAVPAIEHALSAGDHDRVVSLLHAYAQGLLDVGRFRLLARWLDCLPAPLLKSNGRLNVIRAWSLIFTHRLAEAEPLMDALHAEVQQAGDEADAEIRAHLLAMRPLLWTMTDRAQGLDEAVANHGQLDPRFRFPYSVLTNNLAMLYIAKEQNMQARALLSHGRRAQIEIGSTFSLALAESAEGMISLRQGRLQEALARFRIATHQFGADDGAGKAQGNAPAAVLYAEALYEAGCLDEAEQVLGIHLPLLVGVGQLIYHVVRGYLTLARLAWQRGERDRAFSVLGELEYRGHEDKLPRLLVCAELERSRFALLQGDLAAAAAHLRRAEDPSLWNPDATLPLPLHEVETLDMARLRLAVHAAGAAHGDAKQAQLAAVLDELPTAIEAARHAQRQRSALRLTLLLAQASQHAGQHDAASQHMAAALLSAGAEGIIQPFAEDGAVIAGLALEWARKVSLSGKPPARALPGYVERLEHACSAVVDEATAGNIHGDCAAGLVEALTHRELQVVQLLAQGKSNVALAEALFVSHHTVRTHLRNIAGKLATGNRTETVARARALGLIA